MMRCGSNQFYRLSVETQWILVDCRKGRAKTIGPESVLNEIVV